MAGKPYIDFYIGDWRKDLGVQTLSLEERGAWLELLFWMHESEDRGKLILNGQPLDVLQIAGILRIDTGKAEQIIEKLLSSRVARFDSKNKILYSNRMVREAALSKIRADAGRKGGQARRKHIEEVGIGRDEANNNVDVIATLDIDSDIDNEDNVKEVKNKIQYTDEFEIAWGMYPSRGKHSNPKKMAYDKWCRLLKQGITNTQLIQAVKAYTRECHDNQKYGTEGVLQAQTFFGPNARWEEYYEKYQGTKEREQKETDDLVPARDMTEKERAAQLEVIRETKDRLEGRRHGKSDNNNRGKS